MIRDTSHKHGYEPDPNQQSEGLQCIFMNQLKMNTIILIYEESKTDPLKKLFDSHLGHTFFP